MIGRSFYKGLTVVEIVVAVSVILLLVSAILAINPLESRKRARDNKRLSDLSKLERALSEYNIDNGTFPGTLDSALLPYLQAIPQDPGSFAYVYATDSVSYEINAQLEYLTELMSTDGGDNINKYEVGTNLGLMD